MRPDKDGLQLVDFILLNTTFYLLSLYMGTGTNFGAEDALFCIFIETSDP